MVPNKVQALQLQEMGTINVSRHRLCPRKHSSNRWVTCTLSNNSKDNLSDSNSKLAFRNNSILMARMPRGINLA